MCFFGCRMLNRQLLYFLLFFVAQMLFLLYLFFCSYFIILQIVSQITAWFWFLIFFVIQVSWVSRTFWANTAAAAYPPDGCPDSPHCGSLGRWKYKRSCVGRLYPYTTDKHQLPTRSTTVSPNEISHFILFSFCHAKYMRSWNQEQYKWISIHGINKYTFILFDP